MKKQTPSITSKASAKRRSIKESLKTLYSQFNSKDHVLVTIDPDPDSIGAALALKRLLWHKVQSTTVGLIRPMKRLNNLTLVRLLKLPLTVLDKNNIEDYAKSITKYAIVDGQPSHNEAFAQFTYSTIIDHHPVTAGVCDAPFVDIRPEYGATATILTEYLRAAKIKPSQSLATALLYGIKTDTRSFERHTIDKDIEAFHYLYGLANHNILTKVEISDLSLRDLKFFQKAIERKHVVKDRIFAHLDDIPTADILVLIAEFFLKVHDISWSIISGIYEDDLIVIIRNDGYRKDAGKAVARAFKSLDCSAGGHKAMARAEIPMDKLIELIDKRTSTAIERYVRRRLSPFT
ncbi:MAG: DHH family phosphoesterase [Desulforhabdus sp.]|jgi:nanoRNase/pAp phosphatase (c-di-AMP/oligoRNAs hydrolase)|nr:DHH family phosphoesterase [Desulforhabdus sp.]